MFLIFEGRTVMKKILSLVLVLMLAASLLCACGSGKEEAKDFNITKENIKIGVIHITDPAEGSGYTYTHDLGIQGMQANLGLSDDQIVRKNNTYDTDPTLVENAIRECIEDGCNVIFGTSYGYMDTMAALAEEFPNVIFSHGTGYKSNDTNMNNYFGRIY